MRVGLVLGAGGVVGASWLIGALAALEEETGFAPSGADHIIGTSAGSVIGALSAAGLSPEAMAAFTTGAPVAEIAELEELADEVVDRSVGAEYRFALALPPIGPGSWRLAAAALMRPAQLSPAMLLSGLLPRGFVRTDPISRLVERFVETAWPEHPNYWAIACDYAKGERVVFGRAGSPPATVGQAVAASCAIPAFYRPVQIGGRRYVDGGIYSPTNADLLADAQLDLVIALSPMSSRAAHRASSPGERLAAAIRAQSGRRLGREARTLAESGTEVLLIQPSGADLAVMGSNLMARDRRAEVLETSRASTIRALRRLGEEQRLPPARAARKSSSAARARGRAA